MTAENELVEMYMNGQKGTGKSIYIMRVSKRGIRIIKSSELTDRSGINEAEVSEKQDASSGEGEKRDGSKAMLEQRTSERLGRRT
jgi:hypothetical protein